MQHILTKPGRHNIMVQQQGPWPSSNLVRATYCICTQFPHQCCRDARSHAWHSSRAQDFCWL